MNVGRCIQGGRLSMDIMAAADNNHCCKECRWKDIGKYTRGSLLECYMQSCTQGTALARTGTPRWLAVE